MKYATNLIVGLLALGATSSAFAQANKMQIKPAANNFVVTKPAASLIAQGGGNFKGANLVAQGGGNFKGAGLIAQGGGNFKPPR